MVLVQGVYLLSYLNKLTLIDLQEGFQIYSIQPTTAS